MWSLRWDSRGKGGRRARARERPREPGESKAHLARDRSPYILQVVYDLFVRSGFECYLRAWAFVLFLRATALVCTLPG